MVRVLIIDDDPDSTNSLAELLTVMGHEAWATYDGQTALRVAGEVQPALILLDLGMPGMDGFEVARKLRASGARFVLVAVTGYGRQEDVDRCLREGFDHHLLKPAAPADILGLIGADC